jgi:hypothetical protein
MAILIGAEGAGNYGIPPTPYDSTNYLGLIVSSPNIDPQAETIKRDYVRTTFTKTLDNIGRKLNNISFETELKGSGNAIAPESTFYMHHLLRACGMVPASLTWLDSNGANAATCDKVYIMEIVNGDNCDELAPFENVWLVQDSGGVPVNVKAVVLSLGRRKDSDADAAHNDLVAIAVPSASVVTLTETQELKRDLDNAPTGLAIVTAVFSAAAVMWRGAAFMPTSDFQKSVDGSINMLYQMDDIRHESPGALGNMQMTLEDGSVPKLNFSFTGLWADPVDLAAIAGIDFPDWSPPSVCRSNLIIADNGGAGVGLTNVFKPSFTKFGVDLGAKVTLIPNVNASNCSGEVGITDRGCTGGVDPLVDDLTVFNPWSTWGAGAAKYISFCLGYTESGAKGNVVMFSAYEAGFSSNKYQDRSGMAAYDIGLKFSGNEDDEIVIVIG